MSNVSLVKTFAICTSYKMSELSFRFIKGYWEKLRLKLFGKYQSNDFNYVLQPFFFIFKLFGLLPLKLDPKGNGTVLHAQWDVAASLLTVLGVIGCIIGFIYGIEDLQQLETTLHIRENSIISYFTTWAQIFALFTLGFVALATCWLNIPRMRKLCSLIFRIDDALRQVCDISICYRSMRCQLFIEFSISMLIPIVLSMVNCIVIRPLPLLPAGTSPCYWFICFAPILMLTLKEFKFFNLMCILKSKFRLVNEKLYQFATHNVKSRKFTKLQSWSEIPLTAVVGDVTPSEVNTHCGTNLATADELKMLLEIYSNISDGVELLLQIYSWHLLLITTISFAVITIQSYNLFALVVHSLEMFVHQIVITVAWILIQMMVIGINVYACSGTAKMMSLTGPILHKIQASHPSMDTPSFYGILQLFSLEVLHRKNTFTAAGFFNMDNKLITSIIAAVTTYLVIIIQFHLANVPNKPLLNATDSVMPTN